MTAHQLESLSETSRRHGDFANEAVNAVTQGGGAARYTRSNVTFTATQAAQALDRINTIQAEQDTDHLTRPETYTALQENLRRIHEYCIYFALTAAGDQALEVGGDAKDAIRKLEDDLLQQIETAVTNADRIANGNLRSQTLGKTIASLQVIADQLADYDHQTPLVHGNTLGFTQEQISAVTQLARQLPAVRAAIASDIQHGRPVYLAASEPGPRARLLTNGRSQGRGL